MENNKIIRVSDQEVLSTVSITRDGGFKVLYSFGDGLK